MNGKAISLRAILVWEGRVATVSDIPSEVVEAAEGCGYGEGLRLVVGLYKSAAKTRHIVAGENFAKESTDRFLSFAQASAKIAEDRQVKGVVEALLFHNAASAFAPINGNFPALQKYLNKYSLHVLEEVPDGERADDWWCVYEKVCVGLVEGGHMSFEEDKYRQVLDSMIRNESKDAAGRALFLARRLAEQSRVVDAIRALELVEGTEFSAPNQLAAAAEYLKELRSAFAPAVA